jgi:hypothetical protein
MPITEQEIQPGAVAYFSDKALLADPDIDRDDDGLNRPGPFLCVQVKDGKSVWCAITGQYRPERLLIRDVWRLNGNPYWQETPAYLVDGLCTYLGPNYAFVRASVIERPFEPYTRPFVTMDGVDAALAEIERQGGPTLP